MKARQLLKEENLIDKRLNSFCEILSPTQYPIFVESLKVKAFCDGLEIIFPGISEDILYYLYEVPTIVKKGGGKCLVIDQHGKKYDANNLGSYIKFLLVK